MSRWAPKWRDATHDACYRALEAAEADRDRLETEVRTQDTLIQRWMTTAEDEKARADRLARRVAELEQELERAVTAANRGWARVAELEAALRAASEQLRREGYLALAERIAALAGDGGGA